MEFIMPSNDKDKVLIKAIKDVVVSTSVTLADTMTGNAASILKGLVENTKNFYDEVNRQKLYDLYMGIYEMDDSKEKIFTKENLAFLIKKFIQDDEIHKTHFYSKLAINVSRSEFSDDDRIDYISTLSNLTSYEINFMRKIYVYDNYHIKSFKNKEDQLLEISESHDGREIKAINKLHSNGLVFEPNRGKAASQYYKPTTYLQKFIRLIFSDSELTPDTINENEKNKTDIFFKSNHEYMSKQHMYDTKIIQPLKELGYSVIINTDEYGPLNDNANIYISIDNDNPVITFENDNEKYLSLIIMGNEELFFSRSKNNHGRYNLPLKYFNDNDEDKEKNISMIKDTLQQHIKFVMG